MTSLILFLATVPFQDFEVIDTQHSPDAFELTAQQATRALKSTLRNAEVAWPDGTVQLSFFRSKHDQAPTWEFHFSSDVTATLDGKGGSLLDYNDPRQNDGFSDRPFEGRFKDPKDAKLQIDNVAKRFGAPVSECDVVYELPNRAGKNGYWPGTSGSFQLLHKGRKVLGCRGKYTIDIRDGSLLALSQNFHYKIINEEPTISVENCLRMATSAYDVALKGSAASPYDPIDHPAQYVYAARSSALPSERTICCLVTFGNDGVLIDAVTGDAISVTISPRN